MVTFHVSCREAVYEPLPAPDVLPARPPGGGSDVWLCDVSQFGDLRECTAILSPGELAKAHRFKFDRDRNLYIAAHGLLRLILGKYLHRPPGEIAFSPTQGKPRLAAMPAVQFNLSHTHGYVAIAVHPTREIGVDVEGVGRTFEWESLQDYCLGARERQVLTQLDAAAARSTFLSYWTRKEAFLKAIGVGLIDRLPELIVAEGSQSVTLTSLKDAPGWERDWNLFTFSLASFLCSVAQPAGLLPPTCYQVRLPGA